MDKKLYTLGKISFLSIGILLLLTVVFTFLSFKFKTKDQPTTSTQISNQDYYIMASEITTLVRNNIKTLIEVYPDKYKVLQEKLNEFDEEMIIKEEDILSADQATLYLKGLYNIQFAEELFKIMEESGITDKMITEDWGKIDDNRQ